MILRSRAAPPPLGANVITRPQVITHSADIHEDALIGEGSTVWHLAQVREGARIGRECVVGRGAYIGVGVQIGDRVKIQNYALVYEPALIEDGAFIGPAAVLTNDPHPRAINTDGSCKTAADWNPAGVTVRAGASIGAGAVCVAPIIIGRWAMVAAGAVVASDVRDYALVAGVPARQIGWVGPSGTRLEPLAGGLWHSPGTGENYVEFEGVLTPTGHEPVNQVEHIPAAVPIIGAEERCAVDRILRSGQLTQGPEVADFEEEFAAALVDGRPCVAVSSGTAGAHLGLLACGVGPGDEVIVPAFTFAATANAVALTGATPVFVDIEPRHYCLDPVAVEAAISPRTVGIMPVHLYGHPADMTALQAVADRHGLALFEDAAQAHGAALHGRKVGTFGAFAMFSLYATKNMTSGEGGMDSCASEEIARSLRLLRNQGMERRYANEVVGFNARMTDLHAAIGRVQLSRLAGLTAQRQENAAFYDANLVGLDLPAVAIGATHVYHQYTMRVPVDRDSFAKALLAEHDIGTGVYYPTPVHRLPAFASPRDLPATERAAGEVLSLPIHPSLSQDDLHRVVEAVNLVAKAGG